VIVEGCRQQHRGSDGLQHLAHRDHPAAWIAVRHVPGREGKHEHGQELQQADQPQVPGAAGQLVHLPGRRHHHHLGGGAGHDPGQPQADELALREQAADVVVHFRGGSAGGAWRR
jgi:hypothetical protein